MPKKTRKKSTHKHSKKKQNISKTKLINIFLLIFLFAFIATATSYFIMKNESSNKSVTNNILTSKPDPQIQKKIEQLKEFQKKKLDGYFDITDSPKDAFEEYTEEYHKDYVEKTENKITPPSQNKKEEAKKETTKTVVKKEEIKPAVKKEEKQKSVKPADNKATYKYDKTSKPKIVIMIDDVSTQRQKREILKLGYKVNLSILPPTKGHPNSAKIAQDLPFYLIHFPMQASSKFNGAEVGTLQITDSYEKIEKRVKQLRDWYPKALYTNNHTGSVFTQDYKSMDKLFKALKKYNFIFVDSRTTAKSQAKIMAQKYNMPYIVRNTFMDNKKDFNYIQNQLKKAIKIAKKNGYAIAIGHPYAITIKVLRESKHLLKGLEPIYVSELPYLK